MDEAIFFNVLRFLLISVGVWFVWKTFGVFRGLAKGDPTGPGEVQNEDSDSLTKP